MIERDKMKMIAKRMNLETDWNNWKKIKNKTNKKLRKEK